jgi:hypothetical protein
MDNDNMSDAVVLGLGAGAGALAGSLLGRQKAAAAPPDLTAVLAQLNQTLQGIQASEQGISDMLTSLDTDLNGLKATINSLIAAIGALTPGAPGAAQVRTFLEFKIQNQSLTAAVQVVQRTNVVGALLWAIIDVTDPDTNVTFNFDGLEMVFNYNTLINEGITQTAFPGIWLAKADPIGHYTMVFFTGNLSGMPYTKLLRINVVYQGSAAATLNEARGIYWESG